MVRENDPTTGRDLWLWHVDGTESDAEPLVQTPASEREPAVSPDGRFLAYVSDVTGRSEVFVSPLRGSGTRQVSFDGGTEPVWAPDGRELFYRLGDAILAVPVRTDPVFSATGIAEVAIRGPYVSNSTHTNYDVHPDGNRFVMVSVGEGEAVLVVIVNWFEALRGSIGRTLD